MNRRSRTTLRLAAACLALLAASASAGTVFGPYLIWMNLAGDASADQALHDYTHAEPDADSCWNAQALLLVDGYAAAITPALVRRAVVGREPAAQSRLRALLRQGDADLGGYDGVVVVPAGRPARLMSFGADGRIRSHAVPRKAGAPAWAEAFCGVQPPILRQP